MNITYERPVKTDITTATDLVVFCENQLGWLPDYYSETPIWKQRQIEASKLKRVMAKHHVSLDDMIVTARWCARTGHAIQGPTWLLGLVEQALEEVGEDDSTTSDLSTAVDDAVTVELERMDLDSDDWISRLVRARGPARSDVLAEWQRERGVA